MMKTITCGIVVPEDGSDYVYESLLDFLYSNFEKVLILGPKIRDSSEKESQRFKKEVGE